MAFDKEKFKEILEERGISVFIEDPKKILGECGLEITDEQAKTVQEELKQKEVPTVEDALSVLHVQDNI